MLCYMCNKRPASVFISNDSGSPQTRGLCIFCAKKMGIKPVNDIMEQMGITDENLESLQDQIDEMMENGSAEEFQQGLAEMMQNADAISMPLTGDDFERNDDSDGDDDFKAGGARAIPKSFLEKLFGSQPGNNEKNNDKSGFNDASKKKEKKNKHRKHLDAYCRNLTERAAQGKIDNIIGRDREISRVIQILSRRTKNNPCLIGEPGVGKTAIAEGLALKIFRGDVPTRLKDKEIFLLDLASLIAGTQFRGQFESRIKGLTEEVIHAGNIILFIDEVHNLVGTGDSEGTMNAANILKPALSRGEIQVIGATTFNEYRKYIEKDSALERRFQPVTISEPSISETIEVLQGIKSYYEDFHRLSVSDSIVRKAVIFSERYITDRFLPDKAIDLLDEACSCAALRNKAMEEYDTLSKNIKTLENDENELSVAEDIDYEKLAKVRSEIMRMTERVEQIKDDALGQNVTEDDLAHVIELWTGIPASRVKENELNKLAGLEERLNEKIIGQKEAVKALASSVKRSRVQISPRRRPASFIFVGPTGVGKTELVKALSQELFDTPETLIRLDMSEFMEKHSVSRIIGAPPGYVGYDEAGQVTEKVRRRPYSVLLFDEIEKAHPDVLNILLQILDEGKVTDAHGKTVNFENTVIVMTSNAGSEKRESALGFNKTQDQVNKERATKALSEFLRPEFLSRVDEIIIFNTMVKEDYKAIASLMIDEYVPSLAEKGIRLTYDEAATDYLAEKSYGGKNGARDLRNKICKEVEDKIANVIIDNTEGDICGIHVTANDNGIVLQTL